MYDIINFEYLKEIYIMYRNHNGITFLFLYIGSLLNFPVKWNFLLFYFILFCEKIETPKTIWSYYYYFLPRQKIETPFQRQHIR